MTDTREATFEELTHALEAHIDRARQLAAPSTVGTEVYRVGDVVVDVPRWQVTVDGRPVYLPKMEFRLLAELAKQAGMVCERFDLLERVWGMDSVTAAGEGGKTLEVHVYRLRRRLGFDRFGPIQAITGVGYRLAMVATS